MLLSAETIWGALRGELHFPQNIPALSPRACGDVSQCLSLSIDFFR